MDSLSEVSRKEAAPFCQKGCCSKSKGEQQKSSSCGASKPAVEQKASSSSCQKGCCSKSTTQQKPASCVSTVVQKPTSSCQKGCCSKSMTQTPKRSSSCQKGCCSKSMTQTPKRSSSCQKGCCPKPTAQELKPSSCASKDCCKPKTSEQVSCSKGCCKPTTTTVAPKKASSCTKGCCSGSTTSGAPSADDDMDLKECCELDCCSELMSSVNDVSFEILSTHTVTVPINSGAPTSVEEAKPCHNSCCRHKPIIVPMSMARLVDVAKPSSSDGLIHSEVSVRGLCCLSVAKRVKRFLRPVNGIDSIVYKPDTDSLNIQHNNSVISCDSIVELLNYNKLGASVIRDGALTPPGQAVESVFKVSGMCCASEARILETMLLPVDGVELVQPNVILKKVTVRHQPEEISCERMIALLNTQHLGVSLLRDGGNTDQVAIQVKKGQSAEDDALKGQKYPKWNILLAVVCWLVSLLHYIQEPSYMDYFRYIALGSVALCLPPIAVRAFARLTKCALDINILMSLAVIGAVALGDYSEAAAVVTLFALSDWLESRATHRVRVAMTALISMSPETAVLATDSALGSAGTEVVVEVVPVGTRLIVRNGEKFPLDGKVVQGSTFADESALTGESVPVKKKVGSKVAGGAINVGSYVEMESTARFADSAVAKMIRLIEEANLARAPTQQMVEKIARIYTPFVFLTAVLLASIPWAVDPERGVHFAQMALVLLVVACPCALVISTPIAYVCGLAYAARRGILIKGGRHLETLAQVKTMCMDKTGTVTEGKFTLTNFETVPSSIEMSEDKIFRLLYNTERGSSHPLATALCAAAEARVSDVGSLESTGLALSTVDTLKGEGLEGKFLDGTGKVATHVFIGNTRMATRLGWLAQPVATEFAAKVQQWENQGLTSGWIGVSSGPLAIYAVGDCIRENAEEVVTGLKALGLELVMLTGDNEGSARAVSNRVGIEKYHAALLPEDKVAKIGEVQNVVAMIGDGVNDAPSLASADVSISLGCIGSAVALETADIALMDDNLALLPKTIRLGRRVSRKIFQNIAFAVLSKLVVLIITFTVYSSLWLAILVDVGGMLIVTMNSMSLLGKKRRKAGVKTSAVVVGT